MIGHSLTDRLFIGQCSFTPLRPTSKWNIMVPNSINLIMVTRMEIGLGLFSLINFICIIYERDADPATVIFRGLCLQHSMGLLSSGLLVLGLLTLEYSQQYLE